MKSFPAKHPRLHLTLYVSPATPKSLPGKEKLVACAAKAAMSQQQPTVVSKLRPELVSPAPLC